MSVPDTRVQQVLDAICAQGCPYVNAVIEALSEGRAGADYAELDPLQRRQLLDELRAIMAVYERR